MSRVSTAILTLCGALVTTICYGPLQAAHESTDAGQPVASLRARVSAELMQQAPSSGSAFSSSTIASAAVLKRYCVTCHNEKLKSGGLLLDKMDVGRLSADEAKWEK